MAFYRKKPVVIEAIHFDCLHNGIETIEKFVGKELKLGGTDDDIKLMIPTLEGPLAASANDYIIKGVNGEFYPCKPDIFEKTYEELPDDVKLTGSL